MKPYKGIVWRHKRAFNLNFRDISSSLGYNIVVKRRNPIYEKLWPLLSYGTQGFFFEAELVMRKNSPYVRKMKILTKEEMSLKYPECFI